MDASSDVTKLMARSYRPDIRIINEPAPGKGNALRAGLAAASGEVLVAMDADGSMSPEEIPRFVHPLTHGFDFTKGSRFMAGGGSLDITPIRRLGNKALVEAANALLGVRYTDLCDGILRHPQAVLGVPRSPIYGTRDRDRDNRACGVSRPSDRGRCRASSFLAVTEFPTCARYVTGLALPTLLTERRIQRAAGGAALSPVESTEGSTLRDASLYQLGDRTPHANERSRPRTVPGDSVHRRPLSFLTGPDRLESRVVHRTTLCR